MKGNANAYTKRIINDTTEGPLEAVKNAGILTGSTQVKTPHGRLRHKLTHNIISLAII
jgi:hypothetical protein